MKLVVFLDGASPCFDVQEAVGFLAGSGVSAHWQAEIFKAHEASRHACDLAAAKVANPHTGEVVDTPLPGEIAYEAERISTRSSSMGVVYEAHALQECYRSSLPRHWRRLGEAIVVVTNRLFGTFDCEDSRFHLRAGLFGFPTLLSTAGVVLAPARPREYYLLRGHVASILADPSRVSTDCPEDFLAPDDKRLPEVMKGYLLQSVFYFLDGRPFCEDPGCRLFNAHWQAELVKAQLGAQARLCAAHRKRLARFLSDREGMESQGSAIPGAPSIRNPGEGDEMEKTHDAT